LIQSPAHIISAVLMQDDQALQQITHVYQVNAQLSNTQNLDVDIQPLAVVDGSSSDTVEVSGKVIKPYSDKWLYFAIIVDNLAAGLAGAAFIAFLSSLTRVSFTAVQFAFFSFILILIPTFFVG